MLKPRISCMKCNKVEDWTTRGNDMILALNNRHHEIDSVVLVLIGWC